MDAVGSAYVLHGLGVDDREVEAELLLHLVLPLEDQAGGADHDHRARPVAQQELLDHQARLDRLAEADVVGEQKVGAGAGQGALERSELVGLDVGATAEGRLDGPVVGAGDGSPPQARR